MSWIFCLIEVPDLIDGHYGESFSEQSGIAWEKKPSHHRTLPSACKHQSLYGCFWFEFTEGRTWVQIEYLRENFRKQEGGSSMNGKEAEEEGEPI